MEERVKSSMSMSEPRVICASVFDNGPVHMMDTIHTSAGIITIYKDRFDHTLKKPKPMPLRILALIDDYNHKMCYVDIRDHLSHEYNFDGGFWRDRKWWVPIFKEIFKSACDQGFVMYKRVVELAEEARKAKVQEAKDKAEKEAREDAKEKKQDISDAELDVIAAAAVMQVDEGKKIKQQYTHLQFLEKIAEGYVIEAYNSTRTQPSDKMSLSSCALDVSSNFLVVSGKVPPCLALHLTYYLINPHRYDLTRLERALLEMRGLAAPSPGARGSTPMPAAPSPGPNQAGAAGTANPTNPVNLTPTTATAAAAGASKKRKMESSLTIDTDGRIAASELENDDERHVLIDRVHAVDLNLCTEVYSTSSNTCPYKFCPFAAELNAHACGAGASNQQKGQAKAQNFCTHPKCMRFFHCTCHAIMHRRLEPTPTLLAPKKQRTAKK